MLPVMLPVTLPVTLPVMLPVTLPVTLPVMLSVTLPVTLPTGNVTDHTQSYVNMERVGVPPAPQDFIVFGLIVLENVLDLLEAVSAKTFSSLRPLL